MTSDDIDAAERLSGEVSYALDAATQRIDWPPATRRSLERRAQWRQRCAHLIDHDPGGCWVAEDGSGLVGIATSLRRESWWGLSSYFVLPVPRAPASAGRCWTPPSSMATAPTSA